MQMQDAVADAVLVCVHRGVKPAHYYSDWEPVLLGLGRLYWQQMTNWLCKRVQCKMSVNYASGLSPYDNKGLCGAPEMYDDAVSVDEKCRQLATYISDSKHAVVISGAGLSTAAGIPDFRGPTGLLQSSVLLLPGASAMATWLSVCLSVCLSR